MILRLLVGAFALLFVGFIGLWAPNASGVAEENQGDEQVRALRLAGELSPHIRNRALALVGLLWAGAIGIVLAFTMTGIWLALSFTGLVLGVSLFGVAYSWWVWRGANDRNEGADYVV